MTTAVKGSEKVLRFERISVDELAEMEEDRRGRPAAPETRALFHEAVRVRNDWNNYVALPELYTTTEEAWKSLAAVANYAKRRDFKPLQRVATLRNEAGEVVGYRCYLRVVDVGQASA